MIKLFKTATETIGVIFVMFFVFACLTHDINKVILCSIISIVLLTISFALNRKRGKHERL
jgi:hypothetical protein